MRKPEEEKKGSSRGVFIVLILLVLGVLGGIVWLHIILDGEGFP
ncbi:MAG: hypothetical protein QF645_04525 [Planctomycetota bacterium]|nr:hypothetical protein [Planctomycetota bacterium]